MLPGKLPSILCKEDAVSAASSMSMVSSVRFQDSFWPRVRSQWKWISYLYPTANLKKKGDQTFLIWYNCSHLFFRHRFFGGPFFPHPDSKLWMYPWVDLPCGSRFFPRDPGGKGGTPGTCAAWISRSSSERGAISAGDFEDDVDVRDFMGNNQGKRSMWAVETPMWWGSPTNSLQNLLDLQKWTWAQRIRKILDTSKI